MQRRKFLVRISRTHAFTSSAPALAGSSSARLASFRVASAAEGSAANRGTVEFDAGELPAAAVR